MYNKLYNTKMNYTYDTHTHTHTHYFTHLYRRQLLICIKISITQINNILTSAIFYLRSHFEVVDQSSQMLMK